MMLDFTNFLLTGVVVLVCGFAIIFAVISALIYAFSVRSSTPSTNHVIVTGGSSGIGLETARGYLERGKKVTIIARNQQRLDDAVKELTKSSLPAAAKLQAISCDVSASEPDVIAAIGKAVSEFGEVDILINCAGISVAGEFSSLSAEDFQRMLHVNVLGSVYPTRAVVESMKARRRGHVVFVSSQVAQAAIHGYSAYAASKWALRGLAEALQMELKPFNVQVSLSYPPDTRTPGYAEEMIHKPKITAVISETGTVLEAAEVGRDIVDATLNGSGVYTISSGMDGQLLKLLHPGMTPVNNALEVTVQIFAASFCRFVGVFYLFFWQYLVAAEVKKAAVSEEKKVK